jgi:peptide/nickel transport system substrate-binding protein
MVAVGSCGVWGAAQAQTPKTLVIAVPGWPASIDPQVVQSAESGYVDSTLFDRLVNYKPGTAELAPGLAEKWTVSQDGKIYTFFLRRGVTFHDGTPMNARTVAEDLDRAINPNNPCYMLSRKVYTMDDVTFGLASDGTAAKVDVVDDYTLRLTFPQPRAPFLQSVATVWQGIVSPAATKNNNCDPGQHPSGTGPFKFVESVRDDHVTVEANRAYWGVKPQLDRIIFQTIPDSEARLLKLERNEVQILAEVPGSDFARIQGNSALKLYRAAGLNVLGMAMSTDWGPFADRRVRQAMNYAVDKAAINKGLYNGAPVMSQGVPSPVAGYNDAVKPYPYDPARAKALLKEAGFANGLPGDYEVLAYSRTSRVNPIGGVKLGEAAQQYLGDAGVKINVKNYEWAEYLNRLGHTQWQGFAVCQWAGDTADADNFLSNLFEFNEDTNKPMLFNCARYHNKEFDRLVVQARQAPDEPKRVELYKAANKILHDDAPWIFINSVDHVRAARASVMGFRLNPLQMFFNMELVSLR